MFYILPTRVCQFEISFSLQYFMLLIWLNSVFMEHVCCQTLGFHLIEKNWIQFSFKHNTTPDKPRGPQFCSQHGLQGLNKSHQSIYGTLCGQICQRVIDCKDESFFSPRNFSSFRKFCLQTNIQSFHLLGIGVKMRHFDDRCFSH